MLTLINIIYITGTVKST